MRPLTIAFAIIVCMCLRMNAGQAQNITTGLVAHYEFENTLVKEVMNRQKTEMGEAQEATRLRGEATDALLECYSNFIAIACIALEDKPQYLEMLGIVKK